MLGYQKRAESVNPDDAHAQNFSDALPARPEVARPRRRTYVKLPSDVLADLKRQGRLNSTDVMVVMELVEACWMLASGQRSLAFKNEATVAEELGVSERTVVRAVARLRKCDDLVTIYGARMASGDNRGGHYAQNVYDFTGLFLMCGENAVPRSLDQVKAMLNSEGRWVRGLKRLDKGGKVVAEAKYSKPAKTGKAPESATGNPDGRTSMSSTTEADPALTDPPTGGHPCPTNLNPHPVVIENQTTHNAPRPRLRSAADDLDGHSQVVFDRLVALDYTRSKAINDLKKWGSAHVEARIDFVTRDAKNVKSAKRLINYWMKRDLRDAFGVKPKPRVQETPKAARSAPARPQAPTPERPQTAPAASGSMPTRAARRASLLAEIDGYTAAEHHQTRHAMLADRDDRKLLESNPQIAVTDMKPGTLIAFRDRLVRLAEARRGREEAEKIFGSD